MDVAESRLTMEDPSEYRPEYKDKAEFRDFRIHAVPDRVKNVSLLKMFVASRVSGPGLNKNVEVRHCDRLDRLPVF